MRKQLLLISGAFGALAMSAGFAHAAEDTDSGSGGAVDMSGILITAEKRDASVQDTPTAVTAITGQTRDTLGIITIQDITNFTPGFSYSTATDRSSIRGVGRFSNNQGIDGSIAIYSDGMYYSSTFELSKSPIFIERTEILRGPQGTYYGRNSLGGALNVLSRRPTDDWYAEVRANFGNYGYRQVNFAVSGPITDWLRFRIAGEKTDQTQGVFENLGTGPDEGGIRDEYYIEGQLEFNIGDSIEGWVKYGTREWENVNSGPGARTGVFLGRYVTDQINGSNIATSGLTPNPLYGYLGTNPAIADHRQFRANSSAYITLDDAPIVTGELIWHTGGFDVKYVYGFSSYIYNARGDVDGTDATGTFIYPGTSVPCAGVGNPVPSCTGAGVNSPGVPIQRTVEIYYQEDKQWTTHEINLISTGDGNLQWILGAYLYHESNNYTPLADVRIPGQAELATPLAGYDYCIGAVPGLGQASIHFGGSTASFSPVANASCAFAGQPLNMVAGPANPLRRVLYQHFDGTGDSWAVFGQADWEATDTLKFTLGLRYTHDEKDAYETYRATCYGTALCTGSISAITNFAVDVSMSPALISLNSTDPSVVQLGLPGGVNVTQDANGYAHRSLANSWSAVTGTLGVDWTPDSDTLIYAKYTRGYKSGGFAAGLIVAAATVNPEYINAYEIGLKRNWGRTFQLNASIFYYDYLSLQAPLRVLTAAGTRTDYLNIPAARNVGFELETLWSPVQNLQILFNYSLLDSAITKSGCYTDDNDPNALDPDATPVGIVAGCSPTAQDLTGNALPSSPLNRFTANVNYRFQFDAGSLITSVSWVYRSATYYSIFNRDYNKAPAYNQVDLRATWTDTDNRYSIVGYVRNAFDEEGYDGASANNQFSAAAPSTATQIVRSYSLTPPRTYGIELQYRFF